MITDTEGIVLRQTKALGGRRMIQLFSRNFGKISVGTSLNEGGKNKTALAVRAFSYGRYELFKSRDSYSLNSGQVIKSYYALGEDIDKYMAGSYVLELTDRLLPEDMKQPRVFNLLLEFLDALEKREKKHKTLVMAYMVKALDIFGTMPQLDECVSCGRDLGTKDETKEKAKENTKENTQQGPGPSSKLYFSIKEGGIVCPDCAKDLRAGDERPLIYEADVGIINILRYFQKTPMASFEKLALDDKVQGRLQEIMKEYISYHMDIKGLKSEGFF